MQQVHRRVRRVFAAEAIGLIKAPPRVCRVAGQDPLVAVVPPLLVLVPERDVLDVDERVYLDQRDWNGCSMTLNSASPSWSCIA